jgi:ketosteroid isomerase-like protein
VKNAFEDLVRDIVDALGRGDRDYFAPLLTDDVVWRPVGKPSVHGKDAVLEVISRFATDPLPEVELEHIITHGRAAASGTITAQGADGSTRQVGFCDIYTFTGVKERRIKEFIVYVVPIDLATNGGAPA